MILVNFSQPFWPTLLFGDQQFGHQFIENEFNVLGRCKEKGGENLRKLFDYEKFQNSLSILGYQKSNVFVGGCCKTEKSRGHVSPLMSCSLDWELHWPAGLLITLAQLVASCCSEGQLNLWGLGRNKFLPKKTLWWKYLGSHLLGGLAASCASLH